jgi:hypothetical protein
MKMECIKCGNELTDEEMKDYQRNYIRTCKTCRASYGKSWRGGNPEKVKQNREKHSTKNSAKTREYQRDYVQKLKEIVILHYSPNHVCQWEGCSWTDSNALSIDHINNDGAKHLRELAGKRGRRFGGRCFYRWLIKNNFPEGYQILCMNHQWVKRAEYYKKSREKE